MEDMMDRKEGREGEMEGKKEGRRNGWMER